MKQFWEVLAKVQLENCKNTKAGGFYYLHVPDGGFFD
jgi:hypothetical protein